MIAVVFALPQESQDLVRELRHPGFIRAGALPIILGNLRDREIVVVHAGVGPASARRSLWEFFDGQFHERVQTLISTGFAGGLDPQLEIGNLVIAENFSDRTLLEKSRAAGAERLFYGKLASQENAAETVEQKALLARQTGAIAVDMETKSVSEVCAQFGVPMLSVRAVSDTASQSLPVPFSIWFDAANQRPRAGSLVKYLARRPMKIGDFAGFVIGMSKARRELTRYLLRLLPEL